jgi:hypothetical protein
MRFFGAVGYGESSEETLPGSGVYEEVITEVNYTGDVLRNIKKDESEGVMNNDLRVNNSISIVADDYAVKHFFKIRYVVWEGVRWTISSVEVKTPRLILYLGGVYNGPTP